MRKETTYKAYKAYSNILTMPHLTPFGTTSYRAGRSDTETSLKRYKYVGKERVDEETGLYYYGARYYASWIARFISTDPMAGERTWLNPYNYCQNNPINRTDPTGALDEGDEQAESITTHFIDSYTGKYLGQLEGFSETVSRSEISDPESGFNVRSISKTNWDFYQGTTGEKKVENVDETFKIRDDSNILKIDKNSIVSGIETITTKKTITTGDGKEAIEQALFFVIDSGSNTISAKVLPTDGNRYNLANHPNMVGNNQITAYNEDGKNHLILGEMHTHENTPMTMSSSGETFHFAPSPHGEVINGIGMSEKDKDFAKSNMIPIYAVVMFKDQKNKGNIYYTTRTGEGFGSKEVASTLQGIKQNPINFIKHVISKNY